MLQIEGLFDVRDIFNVAEVPFRGLTLTINIRVFPLVSVVVAPIADAAPFIFFPRPVMVT